MKRSVLASLLTAVLFVLAGCGSETDEVTQPTATGAAVQTAVPQSTGATATPIFRASNTTQDVLDRVVKITPYEMEGVRYGGNFRLQQQTSIPVWDPKINGQTITYSGRYVYEKLAGYEGNDTDFFNHLVPILAEEWKVSDDLTTYTFTLRKGVRWHNLPPVNGRELVADDVVFSLNRYREPDAITAAFYSQVKSVDAPDKYTVVIKLAEPNAWGVQDLFPRAEYIVPPELVKEGRGSLTTKVIGTGPYVVKQYAFRQGGVFVRNQDYWGKDKKGNQLPYTDTLTEIFMEDTNTVLAAMRTDQLDYGALGSSEQVISLAKSVPGLRVATSGIGNRIGISFNTRKAPWNDVNVRRAFNMAFDKQKLIESIVQLGTWEWAGPLMTNLITDKPLTLDDLGPYYKYNPAESKRLRIEAGFPDGKVKVQSPLYYSSGYHVPRVVTLKELYKAEGIELDIATLDRSTFQPQYYQRTWGDLGLTFQQSGDYNLQYYAQAKFKADAPENTSFISDPEVQRIVEEVKVTTDPVKLKQYAKFLWDFDTQGSWTIWFPAELTIGTFGMPKVRNFTTRVGDAFTSRQILPWLADAPRTSP